MIVSTKIILLYIESVASEIHISCFLFPLSFLLFVLFPFLFFIMNLLVVHWKYSSYKTRIPSSSLYHVWTISVKISEPAPRASYGRGDEGLFLSPCSTAIGAGILKSWLLKKISSAISLTFIYIITYSSLV